MYLIDGHLSDMVKFPLTVLTGITMRSDMESLLKREFRSLALKTREELGLTQSGMAQTLCMSVNSYSEIEAGVSCAGLLTGILLLSGQEDPGEFLEHLRDVLRPLYEEETAVNLK